MWRVRTWSCLMMTLGLVAWAGETVACDHRQTVLRRHHPERDFLVIGHRGAPEQACENTLASFATAVRLGANALELDVSMTQDDHLVLWHDWETSPESELRPTGACGLVRPLLPPPIHTVSLVELQRDYGYERAGRRFPVTTLVEFVRRFAKDKRVRFFFLDLKIPADQLELAPRLFQRAVHTLRQYGALSKAVFLTPHHPIFYVLHEEAQHWKQATGTHVNVALDVEGPQVMQLGAWPSSVQRNGAADARFAVWGQPLVTVQSSHDFLRDELQWRDAVNATRVPQERMRFIVWTVNDESDLCALVGLGVDGIMTDYPDRLRALVRYWKRPEKCRAS